MLYIGENSLKQNILQDSEVQQQTQSQSSFTKSYKQDKLNNVENYSIGELFKNSKTTVNQTYNVNFKMFTVKKYLDDEEEWQNEIDILKWLQQTDITLKLVTEGVENYLFYLEQICGQKDFKKLKQDACLTFQKQVGLIKCMTVQQQFNIQDQFKNSKSCIHQGLLIQTQKYCFQLWLRLLFY
ncbi:hypothetical protein ABPG72_011605 [Tetrahymena utriculariae]